MTYRDHLTAAMTTLGKDPKTCFVGYNVAYGFAAGTLANVPKEKLIEMPLAECNMVGVAIGLSLDGNIPVLYFERMDFVLHALDAIVNHLDKLDQLSEGIHRPACIIRCVIGNKKVPLFTGPTHVQNFSEAMRKMVSFPVIELRWKTQIEDAYEGALREAKAGRSTMLIDFKDCWEND